MIVKEYFKLQYKRLYRYVDDFGIPAYVGFGLIVFVFIFLLNTFFKRYEYAPYICIAFALMLVNVLGEQQRNDFLKNNLTVSDYKKIRILENILVVFPFFIVLVYHREYVYGFMVLITSILLSLVNKINRFSLKIATPFYKNPFEFIVGFRKMYGIFIFAYILAGISIVVKNFNLGIFAIGVLFFTASFFYEKMEPSFYVWVHTLTPKEFLNHKVKIGVSYTVFLSLPIVIALLFSFPLKEMDSLLLGISFGILFLTVVIVGKYTNFPSKIGFGNTILMGFSLLILPLLLLLVLYFYKLAIQKLKPYLK